MKNYILFIFIFLSFKSFSQNKKIISISGIDFIKMRMSKIDIENITNTKLQPYTIPDSLLQKQDSSLRVRADKESTKMYKCNYKGVELILTFFKYDRDTNAIFHLTGITPLKPSALIQTRNGIRCGITEAVFLKLCRQGDYQFHKMETRKESEYYYYFSDKMNDKYSTILIAPIQNGKVFTLAVADMSGL